MLETLKNAVNEIGLGNKSEVTPTPAHPRWDPERKMMCLVWNGKGDFRYVSHARPMITDAKDILLKVTATTICGSDLHLYKGTFMGMRTGDIPGHEFMGVVEEVGPEVRRLHPGQRVVVAFCLACGDCEFCRRQEFSACSEVNPSNIAEPLMGDKPMAAYGYSHLAGAVPGGQAEYVRVAYADWNCFPIPEDVPDQKALYLTDIIPTGLHAAKLGDVKDGVTVGIWGLGPIGLMCARWCQLLGARKIIGIDTVHDRLTLANSTLGIETIDFSDCDVVKAIREREPRGLDVVIDCVGFDFPQSWLHKLQMKLGLQTDTPEILTEMFRAVRKCGNVSIVGDYYAYANHFPIGALMEKGLTIRSGQCPVHRYWKECLKRLQSGDIDPQFLVTDVGTLEDAPLYYQKMADQETIKVFMRPAHLPVE